MKSMTGYGRGECTARGVHITVELSAVNRKQLEVSLGLPSELEFIESDLRDMVLASVSRGRVNGRVALQYSGASRAVSVSFNEDQARVYRRELRRLASSLKMSDEFSLESLLRLPGVLEMLRPGMQTAILTGTAMLRVPRAPVPLSVAMSPIAMTVMTPTAR